MQLLAVRGLDPGSSVLESVNLAILEMDKNI